MADFRWDPVNGQWVIIAENRGHRPNDFQTSVDRNTASDCPFCYGNEDLTPKEIAVYRSGENNGRWNTRVFANKYPAVHQNGGSSCQVNVGPYRKGDFLGHHEVIVESPDHKTSFSQLNDDETDCAFRAYRDRIGSFARDPNLKHAMLFKNCRPEAGASIEHLHSQILCTSVTTEKITRRVGRARQYFEANGRDIISAVVGFESVEQVRVICESEHFIAFCPFASRFGYLVSVAPKTMSSPFHQLSDAKACALGRFVRSIVVKLESCLPDAAYNLLLHIPPFDVAAEDYYQWHIEIFPRLTNPAGYEWGTGCWINPVSPEEASQALREA